MPRKIINTTLNYSLSFDEKKRNPKEIKFIIFHYTGMKKESEAINRLTTQDSKVSSRPCFLLPALPCFYLDILLALSRKKFAPDLLIFLRC